jgi:DNA repair photolyase
MKNSPGSLDHTAKIPVVREIECVSLLNRSGIPSVDYGINPYTGCEHGCVYCYSDFMRRFRRHREEWGEFVDVKVNAPGVLRRQLSRSKPGLVSLSTVTDPYQPLERRYELTRACLQELIKSQFPVSILTKSALVLRDLDLLAKLDNVDVGLTITTLAEGLREVFEPRAPSVSNRLHALRELSSAGIQTWVFFGPVLPLFSDDPGTIGEMLATFQQCGAQSVLVDRINLYPVVWRKLKAVVARNFPEQLVHLEKVKSNAGSYSSRLRANVQSEAARCGLLCDIVF